MHRGEYRPEQLFGAKEVMYVRACVLSTHRTSALCVQRTEVLFVPGIRYLDFTALGINPARAPVARRQHAVKGIYSCRHTYKNIFRLPYPQKMPRLLLW